MKSATSSGYERFINKVIIIIIINPLWRNFTYRDGDMTNDGDLESELKKRESGTFHVQYYQQDALTEIDYHLY